MFHTGKKPNRMQLPRVISNPYQTTLYQAVLRINHKKCVIYTYTVYFRLYPDRFSKLYDYT